MSDMDEFRISQLRARISDLEGSLAVYRQAEAATAELRDQVDRFGVPADAELEAVCDLCGRPGGRHYICQWRKEHPDDPFTGDALAASFSRIEAALRDEGGSLRERITKLEAERDRWMEERGVLHRRTVELEAANAELQAGRSAERRMSLKLTSDVAQKNAELGQEVGRLESALLHTHTTYCTADWTDRDLHAPECLLWEIRERPT